jgi:hypothetical protein
MGIMAVIFNAASVVKGILSIWELRDKLSSQLVLCNKILICVIGLGDFLVGIYLVVLSFFDSIIYGEIYCKKQTEWLTGNTCAILGVINTVGSQISVFTMTLLSVVRMLGVFFGKMTIPIRVNSRSFNMAITLAIGVIIASVAVAVIPLVPSLEEVFVQGMYYNPEYKVFIGFLSKTKHINILRAYYKHKNESISANMTWDEIHRKVDGMFSQQYENLDRKAVHFYGNDGLCLYKYFVRSDDARRSRNNDFVQENQMNSPHGDAIVWVMLGINLICFIIIAIMYAAINLKLRQNSSKVAKKHLPSKILQIKVTVIVVTDFLCWVPFIVICGLHNLKKIDATDWYVPFAMTVLNLNSVINPLVYEDGIRRFLMQIIGGFVSYTRNSIMIFLRWSLQRRSESIAEEENDMDIVIGADPGRDEQIEMGDLAEKSEEEKTMEKHVPEADSMTC